MCFNLPSIDFFGLKISVFTEVELNEFLLKRLNSKNKTVCFGYSLGTFPYFKNHPEIAEYSNTFDLMTCDGRGIYLLAKMLGFPVKYDISIPNLTWEILEIANQLGLSVLIVGSTTQNNKLATERAQELYPNAKFYPGNDGGRFSDEEQLSLVNYINRFSPDILLIGVSSPKKESFAYNFRDILDTTMIIPFGGAIDILSGKSKPIPKSVKKLLLGSIWRWVQEPKRLFRDSIIYSLKVMFCLIPTLFIKSNILKKNFSIVDFYNKTNPHY